MNTLIKKENKVLIIVLLLLIPLSTFSFVHWLPAHKIIYSYKQAGSYKVNVQVTDNDSGPGNDTTNTTIKTDHTITASFQAMDLIRTAFNLPITESFSAIDTNDDGLVDTFLDPNSLFTVVRVVTINGNLSFLLSIGINTIPYFFWDTQANTTILLTVVPVVKTETWIDSEAEEALIVFTVEKTGWVYITIADPYPPGQYPNFTFYVKTTNDRNISPDMIWRENGTISIIDDPAQQYILTYEYTILPPVFNPSNGTLLVTSRPTITMSYFEEVILMAVTFNAEDILNQITAIDKKTFSFTPTSDLVDGTYTLRVTVQDNETNRLTSTTAYSVRIEKKQTAEVPWLLIILIAIILLIVVIIYLLRMRLII